MSDKKLDEKEKELLETTRANIKEIEEKMLIPGEHPPEMFQLLKVLKGIQTRLEKRE